MHLDITADQASVLRDMLNARLADLAVEIRHTDSPAVRAGLRERRESIRGLLEQLALVPSN